MRIVSFDWDDGGDTNDHWRIVRMSRMMMRND